MQTIREKKEEIFSKPNNLFPAAVDKDPSRGVRGAAGLTDAGEGVPFARSGDLPHPLL